jgi:hypothetical protein
LVSAGLFYHFTGMCPLIKPIYSLTPTTPGTKTLTATYSFDSNFNSSSVSLNAAVSVVDFSVTLSPSTETISSGHTATYTLTLSPLGDS